MTKFDAPSLEEVQLQVNNVTQHAQESIKGPKEGEQRWKEWKKDGRKEKTNIVSKNSNFQLNGSINIQGSIQKCSHASWCFATLSMKKNGYSGMLNTKPNLT